MPRFSEVGTTSKSSSNSTSVTTDELDTTGATLLVLFITSYDSIGYTVTDSKGNTWVSATLRGGAGDVNCRIWYCLSSPTVGTAHTATVTSSGGNIYPAVVFSAFKGGTAVFDVENGNTNTAANTGIASGSITPTYNNALVIAGVAGVMTKTCVSNGGLNILASRANVANAFGVALAAEFQTTATAREAQWHHTNSDASGNASAIAAFRFTSNSSPNTPIYKPEIIEGWEGFGGNNDALEGLWPGGTQNILSTTQAKNGTYAATTNNRRGRALSNFSNTITIVFWIRCPSGFATHNEIFMLLQSGAEYNGFNQQCRFGYTDAGAITVTGDSGLLGTSSNGVLVADTWHRVKARITVAPGTEGSYQIWVDGTSVLNESSKATGNTHFDQTAYIIAGISVNPKDSFIDSVLVFGALPDDFSVEHHVFSFVPTSNGANSEFALSTGSDSYALIDETPPNGDTDYLDGDGTDKTTVVFNTSADLASRAIHCVQVTGWIKATSAGTNQFRFVTRAGGVDHDGLIQSITTSYAYYQQRWYLNPATQAPWLASEVTQFGAKVVATAGANRLSQLYLEVFTGATGTAPSTGKGAGGGGGKGNKGGGGGGNNQFVPAGATLISIGNPGLST